MAISVSLTKQQYIIELIPCLCQLKQNAKFSKCALGITPKEILLFSDMEPTRIDCEVYYYSPFATLPLDSIVTLVKSEIKNNEELKKYIRLDIFSEDYDECRILYFDKANKALLTKILKIAKSKKVKIVTNKVNYEIGSC